MKIVLLRDNCRNPGDTEPRLILEAQSCEMSVGIYLNAPYRKLVNNPAKFDRIMICRNLEISESQDL